MKRGFLLMNTGSPDSPGIADVRRYLGQFLMDPYVVDLPWPMRALLVHGIILRTRPKKTASAYQSIWTENGSPLVHCCTELANGVRAHFSEPVELAMAYGHPSLPTAVNHLLDAEAHEICLLPLFPHYAMATVGSCIGWLEKTLDKTGSSAQVRVAPPYYDEPAYINPIAKKLEEADEYILFSYHGVPERHLRKTDPTGRHCLKTSHCCHRHSEAHATCYRHQCHMTTAAIAQAAHLPRDRFRISFQSRLGKDKWIDPYTDETLKQLPAQGIKRLAVLCPAFFCDCLETLEEIEMGGKDLFMEAGGESYRMIPCLNCGPEGIRCLETLMKRADHWPVHPRKNVTTSGRA